MSKIFKRVSGLEEWRSSCLPVVDKNCEGQSAPTLPYRGGKNCLMSGANLAIREGANVSCVSTDNSYSSKKRAAFTKLIPSPQRGEGAFVGDERAVQMRVRGSILPLKNFSPFTFHFSRKRAATRIIRGVGGVTSDRHHTGWVSFADTAPYRKFGFTLAEVLITLGIIGVVAAMTMPVLLNNIKYHSYDNAKRKVLNSIGEAGKLLAIEGDLNGAADAEDFVKNRLAKKMSIAKFCDSAHLTDCGLPSKFLKTDGKTEMDMPTKMKGKTAATLFDSGSTETQAYANKNSYGFVTGNGYSVNLFYNGACIPDKNAASMSTTTDSNGNPYQYYRIQDQMCFFAIYDMNGKGGPNVVGKDIGLVGVFYPNEETKAVAALPADYDWSSAGRGGARSTRTYANAQAAKACDDQFGKDYRLPDRDEAALMAMAGNLLGITDYPYWSGSVVGSGLAWKQNFRYGDRDAYPVTLGAYVRCVRR